MNAEKELPPLQYDQMHPGLRLLLIELAVSTAIDRGRLAQWRYDHFDALEEGFIASGEPEEMKGVWLRLCYVQSRAMSRQARQRV